MRFVWCMVSLSIRDALGRRFQGFQSLLNVGHFAGFQHGEGELSEDRRLTGCHALVARGQDHPPQKAFGVTHRSQGLPVLDSPPIA